MWVTLIVVSVGTDHHRFDRLTGWLGAWLARTESGRVHLVVQHGTSAGVPGADNHALLPHGQLLDLFRRADAAVLQGGPGGVMDARAQGLLPLVVPRDPAHSEHVDGHQLRFAAHLRSRDLARVIEDRADLEGLLDETVAGRAYWRRDPVTQAPPAVRAITAILAAPPARHPVPACRRARTMWRHHAA